MRHRHAIGDRPERDGRISPLRVTVWPAQSDHRSGTRSHGDSNRKSKRKLGNCVTWQIYIFAFKRCMYREYCPAGICLRELARIAWTLIQSRWHGAEWQGMWVPSCGSNAPGHVFWIISWNQYRIFMSEKMIEYKKAQIADRGTCTIHGSTNVERGTKSTLYQSWNNRKKRHSKRREKIEDIITPTLAH